MRELSNLVLVRETASSANSRCFLGWAPQDDHEPGNLLKRLGVRVGLIRPVPAVEDAGWFFAKCQSLQHSFCAHRRSAPWPENSWEILSDSIDSFASPYKSDAIAGFYRLPKDNFRPIVVVEAFRLIELAPPCALKVRRNMRITICHMAVTRPSSPRSSGGGSVRSKHFVWGESIDNQCLCLSSAVLAI